MLRAAFCLSGFLLRYFSVVNSKYLGLGRGISISFAQSGSPTVKGCSEESATDLIQDKYETWNEDDRAFADRWTIAVAVKWESEQEEKRKDREVEDIEYQISKSVAKFAKHLKDSPRKQKLLLRLSDLLRSTWADE